MNVVVRAAMVGMLLADLTVGARAQTDQDTAQIADGRALALQFCSDCHVVAIGQPHPPLYTPPAPAFDAIANGPGSTAASMRGFIRTTHPTISRPLDMPSVQLTDVQLSQIIDFILSLKKRHAG